MVSHSIGRDTSDNLSIAGSGANAAKDVLDDSLAQQANGTNPVVFKARKGTLGCGPNDQAVDETWLDRVVPKGQHRGRGVPA